MTSNISLAFLYLRSLVTYWPTNPFTLEWMESPVRLIQTLKGALCVCSGRRGAWQSVSIWRPGNENGLINHVQHDQSFTGLSWYNGPLSLQTFWLIAGKTGVSHGFYEAVVTLCPASYVCITPTCFPFYFVVINLIDAWITVRSQATVFNIYAPKPRV